MRQLKNKMRTRRSPNFHQRFRPYNLTTTIRMKTQMSLNLIYKKAMATNLISLVRIRVSTFLMISVLMLKITANALIRKIMYRLIMKPEKPS